MISGLHSGQCAGICSNSCWGPGTMSCDNFIQLISRSQIIEDNDTENVGYIKFDDNTDFQGVNFFGPNYSFTGWFKEAVTSDVSLEYFRAGNVEQASCDNENSIGCQVPLLTRSENQNKYEVWTDLVNDTEAFKRVPTQEDNVEDIIGKWKFVAMSACPKESLRISSNDDDTVRYTFTTVLADDFVTFTLSDTSYMQIGGSSIGGQTVNGYAGEVFDIRYYQNSCLVTSDMQVIFEQSNWIRDSI